MSKRKGGTKRKTRAEPQKSGMVWLCSDEAFEVLVSQGYTNLANNPEISAAVDIIARLIGSMTIHLMENSEQGDVRVKNELSRKIDISPYSQMTRSAFIQWIVRTMYLQGDGNAVVWPETKGGIIKDLKPIPGEMIGFTPDGIWDYKILINGVEYDPDNLLHFMLSPGSYYPWKGEGLKVVLKDVADDLKQAARTKKGFMKSEWKPSIIVKADGSGDEFSSPKARRALAGQYLETTEAGEPWIIPAEQFEIQQVKPLSLLDLALPQVVELDKKTVASILHIPPFVLGVGSFNGEEWNNFINSTIMPNAQIIVQEMTRKLLHKPEWYFRFNPRSLYSYNLKDLAAIADDQYVRGIMTGNEVRDWIGESPKDGLDELIILENYIPRGMIGEQSKLNGGGE